MTLSSNDKKVFILIPIYTFFALFFGSRMSPFFGANEWADPNIYFNVAKGMVNCRVLYTEVFDHKGPLIFFIYALGYLISNTSFFGMFLIEYVSWVVLMGSVYLTARMFLKEMVSMIVAAIITLFLAKLMKSGGSAEEFIFIWEAISLLLFVKYFREAKPKYHNPWFMFLHGLLCTMTLLTKINLVMFWFLPLAAVFLNILISKNFKNLVFNILAFLGGVLVVSVPIIGYLYYHDALSEAYNIYIDLNRKYSQVSSIKQTLILLLSRIMFLFIDSAALLVFPTIGLAYFVPKYLKNRLGQIALMLSGFICYAMMFMAPMFQIYYPVPFLVFTVLGVIGMFLMLKKYITLEFSFKLLTLVLVIIVFTITGLRLMFNTWVESAFLGNDKYLTQNLYNEIMKTEKKDRTLLNLGFGVGNSLFTICDIDPNVRYFIKPNLSYRVYPELRDEQTQYVKDKKTEYILLPEFLFKGNVARGTRYVSVDKTDQFDYYIDLPELHENYELILSDTIKNRIDDNNLEVWYLYKRRK